MRVDQHSSVESEPPPVVEGRPAVLLGGSARPHPPEHPRRARRLGIAWALVFVGTALCFWASGSPAAPAAAGAVVHGRSFTGDPAHGGQAIASEWLQLGLAPGRETVRRQSADGILTTRTDVACVDRDPRSGLCPELREGTGPTFSRTRGAYLGDPNVNQPSDLEDAVLLGSSTAAPAASGPLSDVVQSWQTAPPGHGSTYDRYDARDGSATDSEWLDATTHLPLKLTVGSGQAQQSTYWTYDPSPIDPATLSHGFFLAPAPAHPDQYEQDDYYPGGRLPRSVIDSSGGRFTPLALGPSPRIAGQRLCLDSAELYRFFERGEGEPDAHITSVDVGYVALRKGAGCAPGRGDAANPPLEVSTFASKSGYAASNRQPFQGAQVVRVRLGRRSLRVRVLPDSGQTLALVDLGASTVRFQIGLPLAHRRGAFGAQIRALVSRLVGPAGR